MDFASLLFLQSVSTTSRKVPSLNVDGTSGETDRAKKVERNPRAGMGPTRKCSTPLATCEKCVLRLFDMS
jgi:hypothetical protein